MWGDFDGIPTGGDVSSLVCGSCAVVPFYLRLTVRVIPGLVGSYQSTDPAARPNRCGRQRENEPRLLFGAVPDSPPLLPFPDARLIPDPERNPRAPAKLPGLSIAGCPYFRGKRANSI